MKDYREIAWVMERVIHKYSQFEKKPQQYCDNLILTQPEIHTIAIIGDQEGTSVTGLAKMRGITKGAVSQMLYKLADKGLVEKRVSPNSDSELNISLTDLGKKARAEHRQRHETMGEKFSKIMDEVPEELQDELMEMLKSLEEELDKLL